MLGVGRIVKTLKQEEKDRIESELNAVADWGRYIHPFSGDGIDLLLVALLQKKGSEFILHGTGNTSYNAAVKANDYALGVFGRFGKTEEEVPDAIQGNDLCEVITLAVAQLLGVWKKPRRVVL